MDQFFIISMILLWILVVFNLFITFALVRRVNSKAAPIKQTEPLKKGTQAPNFTAQTLKGESVTLSDYKGRPVGFLFVSPNCGPCREALPKYQALQPIAQQAGVELVLVSNANTEQTQALVDELKLSMPVLLAPTETNPFMKDYKVFGTPEYCMVAADGTVHSAGWTTFDWGDWKGLIDSWKSSDSQDIVLAAT